jgi:hypothetical protein
MSRALTMSREELRGAAEKAGPDSPLHGLVKRAPARDLEHPEQVKLFKWREENELAILELQLLFAIPNFSGRGGSVRQRMRDGARLKAEGRRKGVPDICLPVPRGGYHALYIELKAERSPTPEQKWWRDHLREQGNRAEIVRWFEGARDLILSYLNHPS